MGKRVRERDKEKRLSPSKRKAKSKLVDGPVTTDWNKTLTQFTAAYLNQINLNLTQNTGQAQQSFRMSKHDLRARPVFHHTHDAIEAHLTVVMAALAVARYLQEATGISIARIVRELRGLQEVTINLNGHHLAAAPRLTDTANDILTALSTPPPAH